MHLVSLSYGGGWQSVAMCVMVGEGVLPRPDVIGIADTGREAQSTWDYLHGHMQPYLSRHGLTVEIVPHTLAKVDLYASDGLTLIPAYTRSEAGRDFWGETLYDDGRLPTYCAVEWKRRAMKRWYRLKGAASVEQWIGYSVDEKGRVGVDQHKWCVSRYPLIESGITRAACESIIKAGGLPMPNKSRCWMCPHQTAGEWAEVKARPDEFAKAVQLEKEINEMDPNESADLFLWSGRVPLEVADFGQGDGAVMPAKACEASSCWT